MPVLGVTGGIATGKSSWTSAFLRHFPAELFDADECARHLLSADEGVLRELQSAFGQDIVTGGLGVDRARLRSAVFSEAGKRRQLESILHPRIRERWLARASVVSGAGEWLVVDIPLLFETNATPHFDRIVVVACSFEEQHRRLRDKRKLDEMTIEQILGAQLDLRVKMAQADHLIWNDSTAAVLEEQASLFAACLRQHHG